MRQVLIISKNKAFRYLSINLKNYKECYFLANDYCRYLELKNKYTGKIDIKNTAGLFDLVFREIKLDILVLTANLNEKYSSLEWWSSVLASRNTASTPLFHNITYLFCAKKILAGSKENIVFIVESKALADCILTIAEAIGCQVLMRKGLIEECFKIVTHWLYCITKTFYFIYNAFYNRRMAFKFFKPLPNKRTEGKKRIVIRSWVTKSNFDKSGEFKDRNFGDLPLWLSSQNYEVWILPMFFNLNLKVKQIFTLLKKQEQVFLIPELYLKLSDYLGGLFGSFRVSRECIDNAWIQDVDVSSIFNEILKKYGFDLSEQKLSYSLLKRLKEANYEIDEFLYAFEGNPPEKPFVLGVKKFFPDSKIIGFQHTTFFNNQLAYYLAPEEKKYHPLPDKLICSGPICVELLKKAGFPPEILIPGPNLRFQSIYCKDDTEYDDNTTNQKVILLPLTVLNELALELIFKVKEALKGCSDYKVFIRTHPLLKKAVLIDFLRGIGFENYEFADEGIIQDWLSKTHVVISNGGSLTMLEAICAGVPIIRVIPDNTFFYDPFHSQDYPFAPVNRALDIKRQLELASKMRYNNPSIFNKISQETLEAYFTKLTEDNMNVFL